MKGLLRKDLYMIWRYGRLLLLISALFLVLGAISGGNTFFILYPVLFGGVLPVNLISYEERDGWNALCDTMPVSRKTVVNERYLMTLLCFLALYLITLAFTRRCSSQREGRRCWGGLPVCCRGSDWRLRR